VQHQRTSRRADPNMPNRDGPFSASHATPLTTNNNTAEGILTGTIKQKRSKAIDMRFYWLIDRVTQKQFAVQWEPGKNNLADYPTKHHSGSHHRKSRPIYLYIEKKVQKLCKGFKILNSDRRTDVKTARDIYDR